MKKNLSAFLAITMMIGLLLNSYFSVNALTLQVSPNIGTLNVSAQTGRDMTDDIHYRYGPSYIINNDNSIDAWYASVGTINTEFYVKNYNEAGTMTAESITGSGTAAQKFNARSTFDGIQVRCPSYSNNTGSLTFKLFKWNTNYSTTIGSTAIISVTFANFVDNSWLSLDFDRQTAGDYLWLLSTPVENVGVWRYSGSNCADNINYKNGVSTTGGDYMCRIVDSVDLYTKSGTLTNVQIKTGQTAAQKFTAAYDFTSVSVQCSSFSNNVGNLTLKLYTWTTNYATTIAGTPIATSTYTNFINNSNLRLEFTGQPAGVYLWVLSSPSETVGVRKYSTSSFSGNTNYFNGATSTGDYLTRINYCRWDDIRYKKSVDGGVTWSSETLVLKPTNGSYDSLSNCDPGVVLFGGYYYIGYTSTTNVSGSNNSLCVARSTTPTGPFEKWNGSGWGGNPQPFITYTGPVDKFGIGEPSFVVKDNLLYIYYTYLDGTVSQARVATASATNANWPGSITQQGVALNRYNSSYDSLDVKYVDSKGKFIAVCVGERMSANSLLAVYESVDGFSFYPSKTFQITSNILPYSHNLGISGLANGHLDTSKNNFVGYGYGQTWGVWDIYINPITFNSSVDHLVGINMMGSSSTEVTKLDSNSGYQSTILQSAISIGLTNNNYNAFILGDYNSDGIEDMYTITKNGGSGYTEVHILNGADNYQSWIAHIATPLPCTNSNWEFFLGKYNADNYLDLYCLNKDDNGTTTLKVLDGSNYSSWLTGANSITTPLGATASGFKFDIGDYNNDGSPDLYAICQAGGSGYTEIHILSGASGFSSFLLQIASVLGATNDLFDFRVADYNNDNALDLYCIQKDGASGKTELHVLQGKDNYQSYLADIATVLGQTNSNWLFLVQKK